MSLRFLKKIGSSRRKLSKDAKESSRKSFEDEGETSSESSYSASSRNTLLSTPKGALVDSLSKQGKFEEVLKTVSQSHLDDWRSTETTESVDETDEDAHDQWPRETPTPLHIILQHNPPVPIVQTIITTLQKKFRIASPEEFPDDVGRTPLHVAVSVGCAPEIVETLLSGDSLLMPAVYRDSLGRTPLHWACRVQKRKNKRQQAMAQWHQKQIIITLLKEYPEAACLRDVDGQTPLDYAKTAKLLPSLIDSLQKDHDFFVPSTVEGTDKDWDADWIPSHIPGHEHLPGKDDLSTVGFCEAELYNVLSETD